MRKILKVIAKTVKIILVTLGVIVAVLVLLYFVPVKFVIQPEDIDYTKEFYIVYFITPFSTDSGCYVCGTDPREAIANYICRYDLTKFIVYGSLDGKNRRQNS